MKGLCLLHMSKIFEFYAEYLIKRNKYNFDVGKAVDLSVNTSYKKKKLIKSVTMVGNECEIIESFIRYNINIVDEMVLILNFGSVDNSVTIIRKLIDEGLNVRLYDEPTVVYEQKSIENKYLKLVAEDTDVDIVIPLDADEFISSKSNPRKELEALELNKVYKLKWRNYLLTENDNRQESFIPKRMTYCDLNANTYDKVIVPAHFIRNEKALVSTGHHDVIGNVESERISNLFIAHYPMISQEQYESKLYCSSINFINWSNRTDGEGTHINKILADFEKGEKTGFTVYNTTETCDLTCEPISLDFIDDYDDKLKIKYIEYSKVSLIHNLISTAQKMAIKAYKYEVVERFADKDAIKILVYGTGEGAKVLLDDIPEYLVNVVCYIDSNSNKRFTKFQKRLVITPDYVRLFDYKKIIISSQKYFDEMKNELLRNGVPTDDICGKEYLVELLIGYTSKLNRSFKLSD